MFRLIGVLIRSRLTLLIGLPWASLYRFVLCCTKVYESSEHTAVSVFVSVSTSVSFSLTLTSLSRSRAHTHTQTLALSLFLPLPRSHAHPHTHASQDVKAATVDGTRNDCTLCCAKQPPFEAQDAETGTWLTLPRTAITVEESHLTSGGGGGKVHLDVSVVIEGVGAVRYAHTDYVECVLVNNDSLPLAPFVHTFSAAAHESGVESVDDAKSDAKGAELVSSSSSSSPYPAATPPMGFNSWNFYHCNIDEVTLRAVVDAIETNGMKEAGYSYVNIDDCWQVR